MAWITPYTFTTEVLEASALNDMLNTNMNELAVAKASNTNGYFVTTGANALAERIWKTEFEYEDIEVTSTDPVEVGPSIEIDQGGSVLALWNSRLYVEGSGLASIGVAVEGVQSVSEIVAQRGENNATDIYRGFCFAWLQHLGSGTRRIFLEGVTTGGTAHFAQRELILMPF